jgi:hypothetical protein
VIACLDLSQPSISFSENIRNHIPNKGSLIYTVWDKDDSFLYVGIAGLQRDLAKRSPLSRMISHASGVRSGDQFCVYIHDFYVVPKLVETGVYEPSKGLLDRLTKAYIHENLFYRFQAIEGPDSDRKVRDMENEIKRGAYGFPAPFLNGC